MSLNWDSIPIINTLHAQKRQLYIEDYLKTTEAIYKSMQHNKLVGTDLISFHKNILGKQLTCFNNGEFKFWIWEDSTKINKHFTAKWRIFVSNKKGLCFETNSNNSNTSLKCWNDYKRKIGL